MSRRRREKAESQPVEANIQRESFRKTVRIIPRNKAQEEYLDYLMDPNKVIVVATGYAGTGKTTLGLSVGIKQLQEKRVSKLILTRPVISTSGEDALGALPGDLNEKMDPYVRPLTDILYQYYSNKEIMMMLENRVIEISPLSFMRGRNFSNCFIVLDEAQNTNRTQMKTILTRICEGTKIVITGDITQSDRKDSENGLLHLKKLIDDSQSEYISEIEFGIRDVQRHPVVSEILRMYGE